MLREDENVVVTRLEGVVAPPDLDKLPGAGEGVPQPLNQVAEQVEFWENQVATWQGYVNNPYPGADTAAHLAQLRECNDTLEAWRACLNLPVEVIYQVWSGWLCTSVLLPEAEYELHAATQKATPVQLPARNDRGWWWYLDRFWWSADDRLDLSAVAASAREYDNGATAASDEQRVVPLPADHVKTIDELFQQLIPLLQEMGRLNRHVKEAELLGDDDLLAGSSHEPGLYDELSGLYPRISEISTPIIETRQPLRDFQIDHSLDNERLRRLSARASFGPGPYSVAVTGVDDDGDVDDVLSYCGMYLESRLGLDDGEHILKHAHHVSDVTVLDGVSLDSAIQVKGVLTQLGAHVQIVETSSTN